MNKGEASSESWLLKEELEIWPNYGKRDDRMFTFKSPSLETIQFFSDDKNAYSNKKTLTTPTIEIYDIILKLISIETKRKLPGTIGC